MSFIMWYCSKYKDDVVMTDLQLRELREEIEELAAVRCILRQAILTRGELEIKPILIHLGLI